MKKRTAIAAALAILLFSACRSGEGPDTSAMLGGGGGSFRLTGVSGLERVTQLTGKDSLNATDRYVVFETDLGSMFQAGDRTWFVFGDTFGEREDGASGAGGSYWRSNTLAYATDDDPSDGITFDGMITDEIGLAKELLPSKKADNDEMTKIPTHGLEAGGSLYLYYMSVRHWGDPGKWDANYSSVARSTDGGQTWTLLDGLKWAGDSGFIQVSPFKIKDGKGGSDIYFWCVPSGRFGGVRLMKVAEENVEILSEYEYFAGTDDAGKPLWSKNMADAALVVDDTVGELSVVWSPYLGSWIMTYLKEGQGVVIREGLSPWGPWGDAMTLVPMTEYPGLYAPFMNPKFTEDGGRTFYFTLSLWEPYNVFWFKASLDK